MNFKQFLGCLTVLSLLSGCATLSETECISGNWQQIGYKDGKYGRDSDYILKHESACAEYDVRVDREAYESGRVKGLNLYCTADNGFNRGNTGSYPNPSCKAGYPDYDDGYYDGLLERRDRLQHQLGEAHHEHDVLTEVQRRVKDEEEIERVNHELEDLDDDIDDLHDEIEEVNELLDRYRPKR